MRGDLTMEDSKSRANVTLCSECITITIAVPKDCRMDADAIADMAAECLSSGAIRRLCEGCPKRMTSKAD